MSSDSTFAGINPNQSFDIIDSSMNDDYSDDHHSDNPLTEGIPY
jgi:hypothetical protein